MALTPASILADYSSGIGTQGATLQIKTNEKRVGIGTTNPQGTLQVGTAITMGSGIITATSFDANTASFSGNVSVGGTLTYEDVTNVDSVGIITARNNVSIAGSLSVTGISTFSGITTSTTTLFANNFSVSGVSTFSGITTSTTTLFANDFSVSGVSTFSGSRIDIGTGTSISSPGENQLAFGTNGTQRINIEADGDINIDSGGVFYDATNNRLAIGTTSPSSPIDTGKLMVQGGDIVVRDDQSGNSWRRGRVVFDIRNSNGDSKAAHITGGRDSDISSNIQFFTTASHSLAERMRIDDSGRLLVGTSSASTGSSAQYAILQAQGSTNSSTGGGIFSINLGNSGNTLVSDNYVGGLYYASTVGEFASIECRADGTCGSGDYPGRLVFSTTDDGASSPTERMRITSQGYLKASNTGSYVTPTSGSSANQHEITNSADARDIIQLYQTHVNNPYGIFQRFLFATPNNATNYFHYCMDNIAARVVLRSNGGIANFQSNNVNLCDEREKKNIETLDSTWDCLKHWELKKFHYNEDADTDDKRYGVIAQQVEQYCPEVITDWTKQKAEDAVLDEDGNVVTPAKEEITRMGVKEQQMMWMAIKALQEAQTRIETLESEVAALKAQ